MLMRTSSTLCLPQSVSSPMDEKELIQNIARETGADIEVVEKVFNATIEQIFQSLKQCESVTIRNFGRFYIRPGHSRTMVFKFSPSQKLRKMLGWSSTYRGKV
jgi:DNA-binding protein HU-beta